MKLKECPSCAMEIDEKAKVCPICQYEFTGYSNGIKWTAVLLVIFFILYLLLNIL